uniref:CinA family protein n=1 Tax=Pararhizobium sp. IMCC3301 TaxID=3067904 RepID=UPI0027415D2B|nr:CinA family protein [Pararhizobium sp. IMCC3301]
MPDDRLQKSAIKTLKICEAAQVMLSTVESCTGGLIAASLTEIPGSSAVVEAGLVTYSNAAKTRLAGVPEPLIIQHGAVSQAVAMAMAEGGLRITAADVAIAVTGIAGPGGGSTEKPVGTVHLACAVKGRATRHVVRNYGAIGRSEIRTRTALDALALVQSCLAEEA